MSDVLEVNGLQLFYRDTGEGEPLLLLHGFTGCGDDWQPVFANPLEGYRVITPDLRGHGRSTNPGGTFLFADVARDIFALLDWIGIDRVKAIGMSAGANTLLHMATSQPSRIAAVIHISGTPRFPDQARVVIKRRQPDFSRTRPRSFVVVFVYFVVSLSVTSVRTGTQDS